MIQEKVDMLNDLFQETYKILRSKCCKYCNTCYPMKNINKVPQGIALRLRRICDTTEKYESRADEYKNYLLARDYKPSLVDE